MSVGTSAAPGMMALCLLTRGTVYFQLTQEETHSWTADSKSSFIGGGTFGCNFQPIGPVVLGIEGEAGFMKLEGSAIDNPRTTSDVLGSAKIGDWYAMITPRLGYAWDRALLYVKAGVAFVPVQASVVDLCFSIAAGCNNGVISTAGATPSQLIRLAAAWNGHFQTAGV